MDIERFFPSALGASEHSAPSKVSRLGRCVAVGILSFVASQAVLAQVACDSRLYISQGAAGGNTTLNYSTGSIPLSFTAQGTAGAIYNALGMSPTGFLYAMLDSSNELLQINPANGAATAPVVVTGLPSVYYNSGTFSASGTYYVKQAGNTNVIYAINVGTATAVAIPLVDGAANPVSFPASDMAWASGQLYVVGDGGQLRSIDVGTGVVTDIGAPDTTGGVLGAQFGFTNGLFGAANDGSGFYRINLTTGQRSLVSTAPAAASNDGANCPAAAFSPPPPVTTTAVPIPTLGEWGLMLLAGLIGVTGVMASRRRNT